MSNPYDDATAKWLVGGQLASVLLLEDAPLAAQLAEQGHEVVVLSSAPRSHYQEVGYVIADPQSFPFVDNAFTAVVGFKDPTAVQLAAIGRILQPGGWVATVGEGLDESVPWLRKLRELIGGGTDPDPSTLIYGSTGMFDEAQTAQFTEWEQLGLEQLIEFARRELGDRVNETTMADVRELFLSYKADYQPLRLRKHLTCVRAQVLKEQVPPSDEPPDVTLLDYA